MLFQIKCDCGHVGLVTGLPRMAHCSACDTVRLFRISDGYPIIAKLAAVDEEGAAGRARAPAYRRPRRLDSILYAHIRPRSDPAEW
jgi:hypothetical protein